MELNAILLALLFAAGAFPREYQLAPVNLKMRRWFQNAKFGFILHLPKAERDPVDTVVVLEKQ